MEGDDEAARLLASPVRDLRFLSWGVPGRGADAPFKGVPQIAIKSVKSYEFAV